jgi:hypothetical protein
MDSETEILDDLMPNEAPPPGIYEVPEDEQVRKEINEEAAMVGGARPMFEEILSWFDNEIDWAAKINGLDTESKVPLEAQLLAKQRYQKFMTEAKGRLVVLKNEHLEP